MAVFVVEVEVEAEPFMVVRALGGRDLGAVEFAVIGDPDFGGNRLHGSVFSWLRPVGRAICALGGARSLGGGQETPLQIDFTPRSSGGKGTFMRRGFSGKNAICSPIHPKWVDQQICPIPC